MKSFAVYVILGLFEALVRLGGMLSELVLSGRRFAVERILRGFLFGTLTGLRGIKLGRGVQLEGLGNIKFYNNVTVYDLVHIIAGNSGSVTIGEMTHVGRMSVINGLGNLTIGKQCSISSFVSIYTISNTSDGEIIHGKVTIGNNVVIGTGVKILPGITIGSGATLGAGAVVTKDVLKGEVVAGVPARLLEAK